MLLYRPQITLLIITLSSPWDAFKVPFDSIWSVCEFYYSKMHFLTRRRGQLGGSHSY
jgi:hypothetical protein